MHNLDVSVNGTCKEFDVDKFRDTIIELTASVGAGICCDITFAGKEVWIGGICDYKDYDGFIVIANAFSETLMKLGVVVNYFRLLNIDDDTTQLSCASKVQDIKQGCSKIFRIITSSSWRHSDDNENLCDCGENEQCECYPWCEKHCRNNEPSREEGIKPLSVLYNDEFIATYTEE